MSTNDKIYHVLFLCTGNSARSIMAEALLNAMGKGRFIAHSAGSQPTGKVNPLALEQIELTGFSAQNLRSKSWDEFGTPDAPHMDFVITVCDNAAGETCPFWPGHPMTAHWGFQDPAAVTGTDAEKHAAFSRICHEIKTRISLFLSLPISSLEHLTLQQEMNSLGASRT